MQPVWIRLITSDLANLLLRHLSGQDEDRLGQGDLLATFIVNEPLAPGGHEGLEEVGLGLVDILQYEHGVGIILCRLQQGVDPGSARRGVQKYGPDLLPGWKPVRSVRRSY